MAGRTVHQLATPIALGYKLAGSLDEPLGHQRRLQQLQPRVMLGQCAGAVGTFATLRAQGLDVQRQPLAALDLVAVPPIIWHTARHGPGPSR